MSGTRFRQVIREALGNIHREVKIAITPVPQPQKWVFLVGCYNSGTTLLAELLGQHPQISALHTEGHFITDQFIKDYDIGLPRMWVGREDIFCLPEDDTSVDVVRLKKEWGMRMDLSKPVLLEKSPPNSARTLWLQKNFDNAYFIGIMRNGYAVAEGISRKGDPQHIRGGWPIADSAYQWARGNEILASDAKKLNNFTWVNYEDFSSDTGNALNKIASFLELDPFVGFDKAKDFSIHERKQSVRDLNLESIKRLSPEDIAIINDVAGNALDEFGYERL